MFKKKKNPLVVRTPDKINQDYSQIMTKLGVLELEHLQIEEIEKQQFNRKTLIASEKSKYLKEVKELSEEMDAAQKEIKRKAPETKVEAPKEVAP